MSVVYYNIFQCRSTCGFLAFELTFDWAAGESGLSEIWNWLVRPFWIVSREGHVWDMMRMGNYVGIWWEWDWRIWCLYVISSTLFCMICMCNMSCTFLYYFIFIICFLVMDTWQFQQTLQRSPFFDGSQPIRMSCGWQKRSRENI